MLKIVFEGKITAKISSLLEYSGIVYKSRVKENTTFFTVTK